MRISHYILYIYRLLKKSRNSFSIYMINVNSLAHISDHQIQCQQPDWQEWVDMKLIRCLLVLPHSKKQFKESDNLSYQYN